jgi:hypothetical protein
MSWAIVIWTVVFAIWIFSGMSAVSDNCAGEVGAALDACNAGTAIGAGIGITMIGGLWFIGFIVLSIIWFMSRPKGS